MSVCRELSWKTLALSDRHMAAWRMATNLGLLEPAFLLRKRSAPSYSTCSPTLCFLEYQIPDRQAFTEISRLVYTEGCWLAYEHRDQACIPLHPPDGAAMFCWSLNPSDVGSCGNESLRGISQAADFWNDVIDSSALQFFFL